MSIYRVTLLLDDTVPAQFTLLGQIQNTLASIAGNLAPTSSPAEKNIEVKKLA